MQTNLADFIRDTPEGREADGILRKCVHCGFCTATCPTYQLLGDELDGPRGRIYLIKEMLEGVAVSGRTRLHLDRCLTCRSCETTCPSGVQYARLVDIGRAVVDRLRPRPAADRLRRALLKESLPRPALFGAALALGQAFRPILPGALAAQVPRTSGRGTWPQPRHARRMIVPAGCVQPALAPDINAAAARVLDRLGISLIEVPRAGCCGALRFHLGDQEGGRRDARTMIDAWWPYLSQGVESIVMTASGCGAFVREYDHLLERDSRYAEKAKRIASLVRDVSEVVAAGEARLAECAQRSKPAPLRLAFHSPCSLQHGQKLRGVVEPLLVATGCELTPVADAHLCCGSAGTYSILQPEIAGRLREAKLAALGAGAPEAIATANIGCLAHLQAGTATRVRHWIEVIDERLD
ncbi:MAG: glycolate oxidase iron-sulfur subunit [Rhodocyclales bacterium CG_4_9_14_3_um_filter_68_10]|nr:MAG: glycolate oxidase iron-sulfur subunit [Rhodocyclales bacterium CG_4_10_14_3_um_filter_68_10]PJA56993.1 MAG: glycolate oxidase iron-sulfur subunit [Rhodocyclales bacterium CG_4_9_14_3_um_filter_68_10]